jgi:hypothetical protein
MSRFDQWLDRRAVAIATRDEASPRHPATAAPVFNGVSRSDVFADMFQSGVERLPDPPSGALAMLAASDHRVTRSTALKAAGALLVLVGLPAARPARANADEALSECRHQCFQDYEDALAHRVQDCAHRYGNLDPGRTLDFLFRYPSSLPLRTVCEIWVLSATRQEGTDCQARCAEQAKPKPTPPSRVCSVPAKSSQRIERAGNCASFPPPPPDPQPATLPPLPPGAHDNCANCESVGGVCCGRTMDPEGNIVICACNNPNYPCTC